MLINRVAKRIGVCEISYSEVCKARGDKPVELWVNSGIGMCEECAHAEESLTAKNRELSQILKDSEKQDASLEIVQDVYNAKTVAAIELYAAIQQNTDIPADQKDYAFNKVMVVRYEALRAVILADEVALQAKKNEAAMWRTQIQQTTPKLRTELQEEFAKFHSNYKPEVKKVKPAAVPSTKGKNRVSSAQLEEVGKYARQYGVDASTVQMMLVQKLFKTAEEAAKTLAKVK